MSNPIPVGRSAATRLANLVQTSDHPPARLAPGLTDAEISSIQSKYNITFSPSHRDFLQAALPLSVPYNEPPGTIRTHHLPWPDWRHGTTEDLRARLDRPVNTVLGDIQDNKFWDESWGERPSGEEEAVSLAKERLANVPQLIPVYGHRFLPEGNGNCEPVLSIWGTDVICYGVDLADYIDREFGKLKGVWDDEIWRTKPRVVVEFWGEL